MRISAVQTQPGYSMQKSAAVNKSINAASMKSSSKARMPYASITFGGAKNKNQVAHFVSEVPPFMKKGGVATVANDYKEMAEWIKAVVGENPPGLRNAIFMPYYNGEIEYDKTTGDPTGSVSVRKIDNKPVYIKGKDHWELEEIPGAAKQMQFGADDFPVTLYKVKGDFGKDLDMYMVYTDATARMKEAYADGSYAYSSNRKAITDQFKGDSYAQASKAFVETLPALEKAGFNPETIICSDAQTSFVPGYMAQKSLRDGDTYYKGVKISDIFHNMGPGYCYETSAQNMFADFASKEDINKVWNDQNYFTALKEGKSEEYFKQFIPYTLESTPGKNVNPNLIPLHYLDEGFVTSVRTVSDGYAEAVAKNPNVSPGLHEPWKALYASGKAGGILNGFSDPAVSHELPFPSLFGAFNQRIVDATSISGKKYDPFEPFKVYAHDAQGNLSYESMLDTKKANKINLLKRFNGDINDSRLIAGGADRKFSLIGNIDPKYAQMLENGKDVPLFVHWGRGDTQKGFPISIKAFEQFAKTEEGKNAVLIMGGALDANHPETAIIKDAMKKINENPNLKGRAVFINGFTPGLALASAADATLVPSKFAPCELTEWEGAKYFSTPITTNTQGLAQKNFDPRNPAEAAMANAYKTIHEFDMMDSVIDDIKTAFVDGDEALKQSVKNEFSAIDENLFIDFAKKYNAIAEKIKTEYTQRVDAEHLGGIVANKVKESEDYKELIIQLKEDILAKELSDAMQAKVQNIGTDVDKLIFENQKKMDTTWLGNGALRPSGVPSGIDYVKTMVMPNAVDPKTQILNTSGIEFKPIGEAVQDNANATKNTAGIMNRLKEGLKDKRVLAALAGVAAVGAVAAGIIHSNKKNKAVQEAPSAPPQAPIEQTPPPPPPAPMQMQVQPQQPAAPMATTQAAVPSQGSSSINLANNKFAACFNKIA